MEPWRRIEPTTVQKVGFRTIVTKTFEMPGGERGTFDTVWPEGQEFVAVIALTALNEVIVGRQFRIGPEMIMDEIPGGYVDKGESPEEAGARELREETGYKAGKVKYLGKTHKDTYMNAVWHFLLATDCAYDPLPDDEHHAEAEEHIETMLISIDQLIANAKQDRMTDAVAVLIAYDDLQQIKEQHGSTQAN